MIADGFYDVPPGKIATIVTYLERRDPPSEPFEARDDVSITRVHPSPERYLETFRRIGGPYLWASRLLISSDALSTILASPDVEMYELQRDGALAGVLELDYRVPDACEIVYFGVIREAQGRGFGNHLMRFALHRAWHRPIERVWLHTCTLDDPIAIPFYRRNGFVPYKRQFDIFDDPRVIGMLPADIAPGVPLL